VLTDKKHTAKEEKECYFIKQKEEMLKIQGNPSRFVVNKCSNSKHKIPNN